MKKFIFGFVAILTISIGNLFASNKEVKTFVVGTTSGYAPFVSLNEKGEYEGFDVDVAKELGRKIGLLVELKDYGNMPSLMLALKQKKVDALIFAISITEARKANFELVHYQGDKIDTIPLLFWREIPEKIRSLSGLGKNFKKPVCVEAGSYQEDILKTCPNITLKYFDSVQDVILDLKYGKSLATSIDPALLPRFLKKFPELKVLSLPLPLEMHSEGNGICLNKTDIDLVKKVKKAIEELKREGIIFQLEKKWGVRNDN